jgi:hypothetical protein
MASFWVTNWNIKMCNSNKDSASRVASLQPVLYVTLDVTQPLIRRVMLCIDLLMNHYIVSRQLFYGLYVKLSTFSLKVVGSTKFVS